MLKSTKRLYHTISCEWKVTAVEFKQNWYLWKMRTDWNKEILQEAEKVRRARTGEGAKDILLRKNGRKTGNTDEYTDEYTHVFPARKLPSADMTGVNMNKIWFCIISYATGFERDGAIADDLGFFPGNANINGLTLHMQTAFCYPVALLA